MVARANGNNNGGGGRSSGVIGINTMVHHGTNGWFSSTPRSILSALTRSDLSYRGCSNDDDEACGGELTGTEGKLARG